MQLSIRHYYVIFAIFTLILCSCTVGEKADIAALSQSQQNQHRLWGQLRQVGQWRSAELDCVDPVSLRAPHYYEDVDGYLLSPDDSPFLQSDKSDGFPIRKAYTSPNRSEYGKC